ncbi:ATP-grasp domain-containing protein [Fontibacillus panacisegetis]|nr:ATP-grasp domain-containing protein [Fontibacillus solani]
MSEIVDFKTEWRCFIRYGQILDIRYYKGATMRNFYQPDGQN